MTHDEAIEAAANAHDPAQATTGTDRLVRIVVALTIIITIAVLVLAIVGLPKILRSASEGSTKAISQNNTTQACRSQFHGYYIDNADATEREAATAVQLLEVQALDAVATNDKVRFVEIIANEPALEKQLADAKAGLASANQQYQAVVKLSRTDPAKFLVACNQIPG